jgi:hypothetical protein
MKINISHFKLKSKIKIFVYLLLTVIFTLGLSISVQSILAQVWSVPAQSPPVPVFYLPTYATSSDSQFIEFKNSGDGLGIGGNFWTRGNNDSIFFGDKGVGTNAPFARMEVVGGVKIGYDAAICNASKVGTMRYNYTKKVVEYCNGTDWIEIELKCIPNCPPSNACGDNGCGGSCGTCPGPTAGGLYCHASGNIYHDVTTYTCNNGTKTCGSAVVPTQVTPCTTGCSGTTCNCVPSAVWTNLGTCNVTCGGGNTLQRCDATCGGICTGGYTNGQTAYNGPVCNTGACVSWLVNNVHTFDQCTAASGAVYTSGVSMCQFNLSACPSGWTQYGGWSTTAQHICYDNAICFSAGACTSACFCDQECTYSGSHAWANNSGLENQLWQLYADCSPHDGCAGNTTCGGVTQICYATRTQIGCY